MLLNQAADRDGGLDLTNRTSASAKRRDKLKVLFPSLSDDELNEVVETLDGYCAVVWRIYERLKRERPEVIDELMRNRRMEAKVDSSKQTQQM